jgi:4-amino-4-deoxy-L-arabinose transferase-like glycosyltransferase
VLTVLATIFYFAGVASVPLDGDPAMYATIAKTIVRTGEWTHLTFNGEPYLNKPPLHFWLNALVFHVLPPNALSASLLPGLLGVAGTLLVYALCRVIFGDRRQAFAAALVYLTTPEVVHWSRGVHLETLVTLWILVGLLAAYWSVVDPRAVVLLGVAVAGGWLAKGPQGAFPLAVALMLWWYDGVLRSRLVSAWSLLAAAIVVCAVAPWLWARLTEGSGFARAYFGGQIGATLFGDRTLDRGPLWYFDKLLRTYWPWLPVAVVGLPMLARRFTISRGARLWLIYAAIVMIVITVAAGKKSRYLFQLYPALAAAAGVAIAAVAARRPRVLDGLVVGAAVAAIVVAWHGGERVSARQAAHARDALEIAARLDGAHPVRLTHATQKGEPQIGKIVGFYAEPLLRACRGRCDGEAEPGAMIVTRADEADQVAALVGGAVVHRTGSLALVAVPG